MTQRVRIAASSPWWASATTKWIYITPGDDNAPKLVFLGHYDDRFVRESFLNKLWGLPLYYFAQLCLATSA